MSSTPEKKATREEAIAAINAERDYQEKRCEEEGWSKYQSLESEMFILDEYFCRARGQFCNKKGYEDLLNYMRIAGAIAVRAMENHGISNRK